MLGKSAYFFVVLWYGGSCQEMCGTIMWVGKQDDSTTLQSINSMHWWPSFQKRRIEIRGRIVKSMLSNCSEMLILGWLCRTSSRRSVCSRSKIAQNSEVRMSIFIHISIYIWKKWTPLPRHTWPKSWSNIEDPVSSRIKSVRTPTCRPLKRKTVWGSSIWTWMGKSTELGMSCCSSKTRSILVDVRGLH